jgi:hypothetical protein
MDIARYLEVDILNAAQKSESFTGYLQLSSLDLIQGHSQFSPLNGELRTPKQRFKHKTTDKQSPSRKPSIRRIKLLRNMIIFLPV